MLRKMNTMDKKTHNEQKDKEKLTRVKKIALVDVFLIVFSITLVGVKTTPITISRTYNRSVLTSDGVQIVYDLFEPSSSMNDNSTIKNAVILGHGVMVNKEVFKNE